jgi:hypothetical protein
MSVCRLRYPGCNVHTPYYHPWPLRLYNIFPHYLTNDTIFQKKSFLNIKCVLIFSKTFVRNISHSKKKWARWCCPILKRLGFSRDFRKILKHKISWKYALWEPSCSTRRQTGRQTDKMNLFAILRTHLTTAQLMLYSEIKDVCSEVHTPCGQNVEFLQDKPRGIYSNHHTLKV